ncbi:hypothetical protein [Lacimicrobium sp. SS2-24]|uniref:hypothetical protein n=1 Tax=Lacimicrobium sp. SS2-24 TaxID=2005569 RepID=UPI000B4AED4F|nr:hypothetical protein [Lacimicrobium sp. SS2-24]
MKFQQFLKLSWIFGVLFLTGCMATGKYTVPMPESNNLVQNDKAAIILMRASSYGGAITSPVMLVDDKGATEIVGIIGPNEKMVHYVEPGNHTYMVIGENADFMKAEVEAGKVYYALIRPRMGFWKARFSLTPLKVNPENPDFSINGENISKWAKECVYTVPNAEVQKWHKAKTAQLSELYNKYMPEWEQKSLGQKAAATLESIDGLDAVVY